MTDDRPTGDPDLLGLSLDEAATAVARTADRDPESVRSTLDTVAEDGVVSEAGVQSALAHVSTVVATAENRVENAELAVADARDAAAEVGRLDVVRHRLDAFESRLAAVETRVDDLGDDLRNLVDCADDPDSVYEVAVDIRQLTGRANALQRAADEIALDAEAFERWATAPERRRRELAGDVDAMDGFLDDLAATTDDLAAAVEDDADLANPAGRWLDATMRARVAALLIADLRAELADLRAWPDRNGAGEGGDAESDVDGTDRGSNADGTDGGPPTDEVALADVAARIDDLDARCARIDDRLADLARPAWRDRHDDRLSALADVLDGFEPPVDWEDVQAALDDHRLGIGAG
ncbi:MAG: halo transducer protein [Haloferacaceae archaeon]